MASSFWVCVECNVLLFQHGTIGTIYPCDLAIKILFYSQRLTQHYPGRIPDPIFVLPNNILSFFSMVAVTPLCPVVRIECRNNQSESIALRRWNFCTFARSHTRHFRSWAFSLTEHTPIKPDCTVSLPA